MSKELFKNLYDAAIASGMTDDQAFEFASACLTQGYTVTPFDK
jgi:adenine-specific DNA methylase